MLNEKVFTPSWTVCVMLDFMGYVSDGDILHKHIIDNSCGNGEMLAEALKRYILAHKGEPIDAGDVVGHIHGIEIDAELAQTTRCRLSDVANTLGLQVNTSEWDIICGDALDEHKFDHKMDFVIGNPPYRKVQDFGELRAKIKSAGINRKGMTDLYIAFYKVGIDMLSDGGRMCYITPSTWTTSLSGGDLRKYIKENAPIIGVIDCGHEKVFDDANTYPSIFLMERGYMGDSFVFKRIKDDKTVRIATKDCEIDGKYYFCEQPELVRNVLSHHDDATGIEVKNGYATLADKMFVVKDNEIADTLESCIHCVKASKGTRTNIIFPYTESGAPKSMAEMGENTMFYLEDIAEELGKDTAKENWWLYGRSQAISDTFVEKYAVGSLISADNKPKITHAPAGTGVYGGVYIKSRMSPMLFYSAISLFRRNMDRYWEFARQIGHKKNGGYYYVSAYEMQSFINMLVNEKTEDSAAHT